MPTRTILVIDDDDNDVAFVKAAFDDAETEVVSARDGAAGLKAAKSAPPDIIILNVQMPGKDGFSVLVELKDDEKTRDVPVIMLTGVAEETGIRFNASDMADFIGVEPDAYIEKPVEADRLRYVVEQILG
jgi:CheY-like chemotaxis protein